MVLRLTADAVSLSVVRFFCGYTFQFFLLTLLSWSTIMLPLFSGSYLSYNEWVIGLTMPCMSFHARNRKL